MRPKLRILMVVPYFSDAWAYGGVPRLAHGLARSLVRRGNWVEVITTDALDAEARHPAGGLCVMEEGVRVTRLANLSNCLAYRQAFLPSGLYEAVEKTARRSEIVHVHGHRHLLELFAAFIASSRCLPLVSTPNGTLPNIETKKVLKAAYDAVFGNGTLNLVDRFIAVSGPEKNWMIGRGIAADRISLVPNGIETASFDRLPDRGRFRGRWGLGDAKVVLYLGKITPRKGVSGLVRAFSLLKGTDVRLVVAGNDMGAMGEAVSESRRLGLLHRAVFTGLLAGEERLEALRDADVVVYPGSDEIFGLVPFEALLCGTPVVVASDSGCGAIVSEARIGTVVPPGDDGALAAAIEEKLADGKRSAGEARQGAAFVRRRFDWKRVSAMTEAVYRDLLGGGRGRGRNKTRRGNG